jgi:SAM-dependent methyltransferase
MSKAESVPSKHLLYELSVQSPNWQVDYLPQFHQWLIGKSPLLMREDFCGTGKISCEWVKRSPKNRAIGLDLDPDVLSYAKTVNRSALTSSEQKRVNFLKQDVLKPTREKFDMIGAYNFSHSIFHERKELLQYAKAAFKSLKTRGTFFLEVAGGEDFIETTQETKTISVPGYGKIKQVWEQHQFDPINSVSDYSIHFKLPDGTWLADAFTYHWRVWSIREIREVFADAGFKKTVVLWPDDEEGNEYLAAESADYQRGYLAYVIGVK